MTHSDSRLEYVRGLLEAQELTEDERRDRALLALVDQVTELSSRVARLTDEVQELRIRGSVEVPRATEPTESVFCPGCATRIGVPAGAHAPIEVRCPRCEATLEVE
jgi:hypothetical protein